MSKKKLMWIFILIVFELIIVAIAIFVKPRDTSNDNTVELKKATDSKVESDTNINTNDSEEKKEYKRTILDDGILYSDSKELPKADITIGTQYFDTTINDMYLYPENYSGKNIEIEGLYLKSDLYTFIGRYSAVSVCPYCSGGFSYIQYEFNGDIQEELTDRENWIKIIGTWEKGKINYGTAENPYYFENYYLKVSSFEIMSEKGDETIIN